MLAGARPEGTQRWANIAARACQLGQAVADVVYDDLRAAEEECRMFRAALGGLVALGTALGVAWGPVGGAVALVVLIVLFVVIGGDIG